jgi:predicted lipoprotein with Yx(FWY)xxD motif
MSIQALAIRPRRIAVFVALIAAIDATLTLFVHPAQSTPTARATVQVRTTSLGKILADARGRTLYLFEADKGKVSACYTACAKAWPPLYTTGKPIAGKGAKANLLGTTKRKDGRLQVTYAGHPVYFFFKDTKAGQTNGENLDFFGGEWYAVSAAGKKVKPKAGTGTTTTTGGTTTTPTPTTTTTTTTGSTGGGGGYGYGYSG